MDAFGITHGDCGPWASTEYHRRRRAGHFSGAAVATAADAAGPATPALWFLGTAAPSPLPPGLLSMARGPRLDPDWSSGSKMTSPGLGLRLGLPAGASSADVAVPPCPPSSDGATHIGTAAVTSGRSDIGRVLALERPRTGWLAEVPAATSVDPASCRLRRH